MTIHSKLLSKASFTTEEAKHHGLSPRMLSYYVEKGELERLARGVYRFADYISKDKNLGGEELAVAAKCVSGGVICLVSALNYYGLTDERIKEHWIAVPNSYGHAHFPMTRIVRMRNITLGVKSIKVAEIEVKIFDVERTIIDSFRILDFETAMKALKLYVSGRCGKPDIKKLNKYSKELRGGVSKYLAPLLV